MLSKPTPAHSRYLSNGTLLAQTRRPRQLNVAGMCIRHCTMILVHTCSSTGLQTTIKRPGATTLHVLGSFKHLELPGLRGAAIPGAGVFPKSIYMSYWLANDAWHLYINESTAADSIGYYPTSLFRVSPNANGIDGILQTKATAITYGGEVAGANSFPPMGTGVGVIGFQRKIAARHGRISYYPYLSGPIGNPDLSIVMTSPNCYTAGQDSSNATVTLYFGGPGGSNC